jgi:hypothetical protein
MLVAVRRSSGDFQSIENLLPNSPGAALNCSGGAMREEQDKQMAPTVNVELGEHKTYKKRPICCVLLCPTFREFSRGIIACHAVSLTFRNPLMPLWLKSNSATCANVCNGFLKR